MDKFNARVRPHATSARAAALSGKTAAALGRFLLSRGAS